QIPGNATIVKKGSIKYYYTLAVAEYIVVNARLPLFYEKRDDVKYLQTWHGTPLKRLGGDIEEVHMPGTNTEKYNINFYNESQKMGLISITKCLFITNFIKGFLIRSNITRVWLSEE